MEQSINRIKNICLVGFSLCLISCLWLIYQSYTSEKLLSTFKRNGELSERTKGRLNYLNNASNLTLEMALLTKSSFWINRHKALYQDWDLFYKESFSKTKKTPIFNLRNLQKSLENRRDFENSILNTLSFQNQAKATEKFNSQKFSILKEESFFLEINSPSFPNKEAKLINIKWKILLLDELLSMTTKISALKKDSPGLEKFIFYEKILKSTLQEAKNLIDPKAYQKTLKKINLTNRNVTVTEKKAFSLISKGQYKQAIAILNRPEYVKQKNRYKQNVLNLERPISNSSKKDQLSSKLKLSFIGIQFLIKILFLTSAFLLVKKLKLWQKKLHDRMEKLKRFQKHLSVIQEQDRQRISRDVHDLLGQNATALKMSLGFLKSKTDPNLSSRITDMMDITDQIISDIQQISFDLRPSLLDHFGLASVLKTELNRFQERSGVNVKIQIDQNLPPFKNKDIENNLYRVIQEGLTNIARHSKANNVNLSLYKRDSHTEIILADDGVGFNPEIIDSEKSLGILSMSERCKMNGVKYHCLTQEGSGTEIRLTLDHRPF